MQALESGSRAQAVAHSIERAILDQRFKAGQRLPPERELSETLKVSRATLREGLGLLVARGLLVRRQGDGTYISDGMDRRMAEIWSDMAARHPLLQGDLIEFREMLESRTAELAAARRDAADRERLMRCWEDVDRAYAGGDRREQVQSDVAFHRAIADAAHNPVFSYLIASLLNLLHENVQLSIAGLSPNSETARELRTQHRALLDAILGGDTAAARRCAGQHMEFVKIRLNDLVRLRDRSLGI